MPISVDALSSLASEYAKGMTSIRGRRVQRLVKREFADAEYGLVVRVGSGDSAVLGVSATGADFCASDGKGKSASVFRWLHGSTEAVEARFDLLKDSLPVLGTRTVPLAGLAGQAPVSVPADSVPSPARALVSKVIQALA